MSPSIHENILRILSWIEIALIIYILKREPFENYLCSIWIILDEYINPH